MNWLYRWMARSSTAERRSWNQLSTGWKIHRGVLVTLMLALVSFGLIIGEWRGVIGGGFVLAWLLWDLFIFEWWQASGRRGISRAQWHALLLAPMIVWTAKGAIDGNPWFFYRLGGTALFAYWLYVTIRERGWHPRRPEDAPTDPPPED